MVVGPHVRQAERLPERARKIDQDDCDRMGSAFL